MDEDEYEEDSDMEVANSASFNQSLLNKSVKMARKRGGLHKAKRMVINVNESGNRSYLSQSHIASNKNKRKIRNLLHNNKALARALEEANQIIAQQNKSLATLHWQLNCRPILSMKLHEISKHLNEATMSLSQAIQYSGPLAEHCTTTTASTTEIEDFNSVDTEATKVPAVNDDVEYIPLARGAVEKPSKASDMSLIAEVSFCEDVHLPPILFENDNENGGVVEQRASSRSRCSKNSLASSNPKISTRGMRSRSKSKSIESAKKKSSTPSGEGPPQTGTPETPRTPPLFNTTSQMKSNIPKFTKSKDVKKLNTNEAIPSKGLDLLAVNSSFSIKNTVTNVQLESHSLPEFPFVRNAEKTNDFTEAIDCDLKSRRQTYVIPKPVEMSEELMEVPTQVLSKRLTYCVVPKADGNIENKAAIKGAKRSISNVDASGGNSVTALKQGKMKMIDKNREKLLQPVNDVQQNSVKVLKTPKKLSLTPSKDNNIPSKSGITPGKSNVLSGKSGNTPVKSNVTPGKSGATLGISNVMSRKSGLTPRKSGTTNVKSNATHGKLGAVARKSISSPGKSSMLPDKLDKFITIPGKSGTTSRKSGATLEKTGATTAKSQSSENGGNPETDDVPNVTRYFCDDNMSMTEILPSVYLADVFQNSKELVFSTDALNTSVTVDSGPATVINHSDTDKPVETIITDEPVETMITGKPVETKITGKPVETKITDKPVETNITDKLVETNINGKPVETNIIDKPVETMITDEPVETITTATSSTFKKPKDIVDTSSDSDFEKESSPVKAPKKKISRKRKSIEKKKISKVSKNKKSSLTMEKMTTVSKKSNFVSLRTVPKMPSTLFDVRSSQMRVYDLPSFNTTDDSFQRDEIGKVTVKNLAKSAASKYNTDPIISGDANPVDEKQAKKSYKIVSDVKGDQLKEFDTNSDDVIVSGKKSREVLKVKKKNVGAKACKKSSMAAKKLANPVADDSSSDSNSNYDDHLALVASLPTRGKSSRQRKVINYSEDSCCADVSKIEGNKMSEPTAVKKPQEMIPTIDIEANEIEVCGKENVLLSPEKVVKKIDNKEGIENFAIFNVKRHSDDKEDEDDFIIPVAKIPKKSVAKKSQKKMGDDSSQEAIVPEKVLKKFDSNVDVCSQTSKEVLKRTSSNSNQIIVDTASRDSCSRDRKSIDCPADTGAVLLSSRRRKPVSYKEVSIMTKMRRT